MLRSIVDCKEGAYKVVRDSGEGLGERIRVEGEVARTDGEETRKKKDGCYR
jgi:hypothetical protein